RNNTWRFRPMALSRFIIVRKRAVKGILTRREFYRNVIAAMRRIRIVHPPIILGRFLFPGAYPVGNGIVTSRFLADPEDSCYNLTFPREPLSRLTRISG